MHKIMRDYNMLGSLKYSPRRLIALQKHGMKFSFLMLCAALLSCSPKATESLVLNPAATVYRLGSGDEIKITIYGEAELSGTYAVQGQGMIAFPLLGDVEAGGRSVAELRELIALKLMDGLIDRPNVTVNVINLRPYYILGEVTKPGEFSYVEGLTILSSIARAAGFTYRANKKAVYITHAGAKDERLYRLEGGTPVQPGDTIRIGERIF